MYQKTLSPVLHTKLRLPKSMRALNWRRYLEIYFGNVDVEDVAKRDPQELAGAALSHLTFAMRRRRSALVRVFNPTLREDGFVSPHTIIDVVNDDMPFLVDSINLALQERSLTLHFITHPVFAVERTAAGVLRSLKRRVENGNGAGLRLESFQHLEIDRIVDPAALRSLEQQIERSLRDVRVAYADWARMRHAAHIAAEDLAGHSARFDANDLSETCALLAWMDRRHFLFLGYREYRLAGRKGRERLDPVVSTGLGIFASGYGTPACARDDINPAKAIVPTRAPKSLFIDSLP